MARAPEVINMSGYPSDLPTRPSEGALDDVEASQPVNIGAASATGENRGRMTVRRWWLAGLTALLGMLAGAGYASIAPPSYAARSYLLVVPQQPGEDTAAGHFAQAYGRIAAHPEVIGVLAGGLGTAPQERTPTPAAAATPTARRTADVRTAGAPSAPVSATEVRRHVQAATSPDAPVIEITGTAGEPRRAADLANLVATSLVTYANRRMPETRMRMVLLSPAYPPIDAAAPRPNLAVAIGATAGLLAGGFAVLAGLGRRRPRPRKAARQHAGTVAPEPGRAARARDDWHGHETSPVDPHPDTPTALSNRMVRR